MQQLAEDVARLAAASSQLGETQQAAQLQQPSQLVVQQHTASLQAPVTSAGTTPDFSVEGWEPFDDVQLVNGITAAVGWVDMAVDPSLEIAGLSEEGWEEMACFEIVSDATDYVNTNGKVSRSAREVRDRLLRVQRQFGTTPTALADFERDANRRLHRAEEAAIAAAAACAAVPPAAAASSPAPARPIAAGPVAARPIAALPSAKRPCPNPFANPFAAGPRAIASLPAVHRAVPTPECLQPAVQCCFAPRAPPLRAPPQRTAAGSGGKARGAKQRRTQWSGREERALYCSTVSKCPLATAAPTASRRSRGLPACSGRPSGPERSALAA